MCAHRGGSVCDRGPLLETVHGVPTYPKPPGALAGRGLRAGRKLAYILSVLLERHAARSTSFLFRAWRRGRGQGPRPTSRRRGGQSVGRSCLLLPRSAGIYDEEVFDDAGAHREAKDLFERQQFKLDRFDRRVLLLSADAILGGKRRCDAVHAPAFEEATEMDERTHPDSIGALELIGESVKSSRAPLGATSRP